MVRTALLALVLLLVGCEDGPDARTDLLGENAFTGAISHDGRTYVMGGRTSGIRVWANDVELWNKQHRPGVQTTLAATSLSPNGRRLVTASGNEYVVWAVESGRQLYADSVPGTIQSIAVDNTSGVLVGALGGAYYITPRGDGLALSTQNTRAVALDGRRWIVGDDSGLVTVWEVNARSPFYTFQLEGRVESVSIFQNQVAASARNYPIAVRALDEQGVNLDLPQESNTYPQPVGTVTLQLVKDGLWTANNMRRAAFWDLNLTTGEPAQEWRMPTRGGANPGSGRVVSFSRDEDRVRALTGTGHLVELIRSQ